MDARTLLLAVSMTISMVMSVHAQVFVGQRAVAESRNFRVFATSQSLANEVLQTAENNRRELALHWLGKELPPWSRQCPIHVETGPRMLASGETKYSLGGGHVTDFQMTVRGTPERILDSVLPHEITHTIMASYFARLGKPVPRWADEGACTTVEHSAERSKHDHMLVQFLSEGRGIPFATLFTLEDYPRDYMPLYAQGYSLSCFLIAQGGPQRFIQFLERGMQTDDWVKAIDEFYEYPRLGKLQTAWNNWVRDGGGQVAQYTATSLGYSKSAIAMASSNGSAAGDVQLASATQPLVAVANNTLPTRADVQVSQPAIANNLANNVPANVSGNGMTTAANNTVSRSGGSYYLQQFQREQQRSGAGNGTVAANNASAPFVPSVQPQLPTTDGAVPHVVSQPAPFQSFGGGPILR